MADTPMRPYTATTLAPIALALSLIGSAHGQQTDAAPSDAKPVPAQAPAAAAADRAAPLAPVVVTATRTPRIQLDVPASVDVVDQQQLTDAQLRVNLSEGLARVPGLVILNRQNYAQDLQLSIRGFGARSSFGERGVRLYVDGVPASFPDGQGQVSHFPLNAADHVEVLRGPFSALYGNSSGGVVALTTDLKPQPTDLDVSFAYGGFNTFRVGFDGKGGQDANAFNLDADRFRTDGYRTHSAVRRDSTNLAALLGDTPLGKAKIFINALYMPSAQDAMGLTSAQAAAAPNAASPQALQFNTRKATHQNTIGTTLDSNLGPLLLTSTAWLGSRDVTQYQAIPTTTQAAPTSPGGVIQFNRDFGGTDLRLTYARGAWTTSGGLDYERMNERRKGFNNFVGTALGIEGTLRRDEMNVVTALAPYLQTEWRIADQWIADAGVRSSRVKIDNTNQLLGNGAPSSTLSFTGVEPTAGLVYRITPRFSAYASYGRGFETPTLNELAYRPDGNPGLNTALQAARSNNGEIGFKAALAPTLHYTLALFDTHTKSDLVVQTNSGGRSSYSNVGRTRRRGVEASLDWSLTPRWSTALGVQAIKATFSSAFLTCAAAPCTTPTLPVAGGNKLPGVPARTLFAELKYHPGPADLTLEVRASSKLYADDRNTDSAPGYAIADFAIAKTLDLGRYKPRVFGRIDNLAGNTYIGSVIVNESNSRYFEPSPGRTWLVGMDLPL